MIRFSERRILTALIATLLVLVLTMPGQAAYRVARPISNGQFDQGYKYGSGGVHRGLDFPYVLGTDVYAIASGTVVNLRENIDNGTPGNSAYGNFVLIQRALVNIKL